MNRRPIPTSKSPPMLYGIRMRGQSITVDLSGPFQGDGPEQVGLVREVTALLREAIKVSGARRVEFDFRELRYTGGNSIGWIWVAAHKEGLECRVRATGSTRDALAELMEIGVRVEITD